ncbi:beta-N-acetylhexosaminidase [Litoribrevibacter albus]|uniref:Beta-hexosaminidase n=1 Tax=Litoribrevibacter albus TaxID=1473156 RepID=A0AA37S6W5_9GAMM|nr:beta-N-acetylhexosaminidase [Litoribrevibacter albus]GLQ30202.1 beta-hexosaminidase [Litoribrevibacter albus]
MEASVVLDLKGLSVADDEISLLQHPLTAGVILFTRNFESKEQLISLCSEIKSINPDLFISVDHEGGRVQRFRDGFTRIPSMGAIGRLYHDHQRYAMRIAELAGFVMAAELRLCGVDLSYAPVLDLNLGLNDVIGDRAFSDRPDIVADLAVCLLNGIEHAGMVGVGKHFPGHGHVDCDSHHELPHDARCYEEIINKDVFPFRLLIESGLQGIMPAHVIYDQVDPERPAGFSARWLQQELREGLGFKGVIFSDDLSMQGAVKAEPTAGGRALAAMAAGCNLLLVCNDQEAARSVLDTLTEKAVQPFSGGQAFIPTRSETDISQTELAQAQQAIRDFNQEVS